MKLFGNYLEDSRNRLTHNDKLSPWLVTTQYLPERDLSTIHHSSQTTEAAYSFSTCTFKVRISGLQEEASVLALLEQTGNGKSLSQVQELLAYHMNDAAYLQVSTQAVRPVSAYIEATPQQERYIDIVFVFPLTATQLKGISKLDFVLDKAFFLTSPIHVSFATTDILAISS